MYIFGIFQTIEQDTAFSAAIWDGQTLASLHFPFAFPNSYFAAITDAVSHNGKIYVGGNFMASSGGTNTVDFAWYDGTNWNLPDQGILGPTDDIGAITVYKDQIYVGGGFKVSSGNAIMSFNSGSFDAVGGSFDSELANITEMIVYDNKLFVFGLFDSVGGGIPAQNMASWDGEQWCGYDFEFDGRIDKAAVIGDRLYISGGFKTINNDTFNHIAYWDGAFSPLSCNMPLHTTSAKSKNIVAVYPNPSKDFLSVRIDDTVFQKGTIFITNTSGQEVYRDEFSNRSGWQQKIEIETHSWSAGVYFLSFISEAGLRYTQKVIVK